MSICVFMYMYLLFKINDVTLYKYVTVHIIGSERRPCVILGVALLVILL